MDLFALNPKEKQLDKCQVETVQQKQNELQFIGSAKKVPGHTLFSYKRTTGEIKVARVNKTVEMNMYGEATTKETLVVEADCHYEQALNERNFIKRLKRQSIFKE